MTQHVFPSGHVTQCHESVKLALSCLAFRLPNNNSCKFLSAAQCVHNIESYISRDILTYFCHDLNFNHIYRS
jgi:hypothetical protein